MTENLSSEAIALLNKLAKGFGEEESAWIKDEAVMVYCNPQQEEIWSIANPEGDGYIAAPSDRLRGTVVKLWFKRCDDGKVNWYLKVWGMDGKNYIIVSTHERTFSKTMLTSLAQLSVAHVQQPMTIRCSPWSNSQGRTQFCALEVAGVGEVAAPHVEDSELPAIAQAAQAVVAKANGYQYVPPQSQATAA